MTETADAGRGAEIRAALARVRGRVARAALRVGREPAEVCLVGVGKGFAVPDLEQAVAVGLADLGENRVQEALPKVAALPGVRWHLIGQLQRNKARAVVGRFALIHSVDRPELAESLARAAEDARRTQDVLVQVNVLSRPGQGGVPPQDAEALVIRIRDLGPLRVRGLMTIAPLVEDPEAVRMVFRSLRVLRDRLQVRLGVVLPELSMGMSGDLEAAVEEGATLVRVGRAIFGARPAGPGGPGLRKEPLPLDRNDNIER